jgi:hypothetical protein
MYLNDLHTPPHLGGYSLNPSTEGTKLMLYKSTKVLAGVCCALAILIVLTFLKPTLLMAQSDICVTLHTPSEADCGDWEFNERTITLQDYGVQYGNCPITIGYWTRECTVIQGQCTTVFEQFKYSWFDFEFTDDDKEPCYEFTQWLFAQYGQNYFIGQAAFSAFLLHSLTEIMDIHFIDYFNSLTPQEQYAKKCDGTSPNCSFPDCPMYLAQYTDAKCIDFCIDPTLSPPRIVVGQCNTTPPSCCIIEAEYCPCYDQFGTFIGFEKNITHTSDVGGCSGNGAMYEVCEFGPGNQMHYQPCTLVCPED